MQQQALKIKLELGQSLLICQIVGASAYAKPHGM